MSDDNKKFIKMYYPDTGESALRAVRVLCLSVAVVLIAISLWKNELGVLHNSGFSYTLGWESGYIPGQETLLQYFPASESSMTLGKDIKYCHMYNFLNYIPGNPAGTWRESGTATHLYRYVCEGGQTWIALAGVSLLFIALNMASQVFCVEGVGFTILDGILS